MDDLELLNTRRPTECPDGWGWTGMNLSNDDWKPHWWIPADIFSYLHSGFGVSGDYAARGYLTEGEAVLDLYRAWQAARPSTFPLVEACGCEQCRRML